MPLHPNESSVPGSPRAATLHQLPHVPPQMLPNMAAASFTHLDAPSPPSRPLQAHTGSSCRGPLCQLFPACLCQTRSEHLSQNGTAPASRNSRRKTPVSIGGSRGQRAEP